jgi:hypothetical protein
MKILHTRSIRRGAVLAAMTAAFAFAATAEEASETAAAPDAAQVRAVKMKYAAARVKVQADTEYQAALKRAEEARKAAEAMFFAKMRRVDPELKEYLDRLEGKQASSTGAPAAR